MNFCFVDDQRQYETAGTWTIDNKSNYFYVHEKLTKPDINLNKGMSLKLLDKLDLMIMDEMEDNARQSILALSKKLGAKRTTILRRLNRLMDEGIVTIACTVHPEFLGHEIVLVLGINVHPGNTSAVATQLAGLQEINVVFMTTGRYDIMTGAILRDRLALEHFVSERLSAISDIATTDIIFSYKWTKLTWKYTKPPKENSSNFVWGNPSDLDLSIIKAMQTDPRKTLKELSRTVGCRINIAKSRLENLIKEGALKFTINIDPTALGYEIGAMILIRCRQDKINAVANKLSALEIARHVSLITGQWQIIMMGQFMDNRHMNNFLLEELPKISGVIKYEVIQLVKTLKYNSNLLY